MGKQKQRAAYMRGYRDSLQEQEQFLSDMERSLYAIALNIETSPSLSIDSVIDQINTLRTAIDEFRDETYGGMDFDEEGTGFRPRTIIDLQEEDNTFLEGIDEDELIDDKTMKFLQRRDIVFDDDDE